MPEMTPEEKDGDGKLDFQNLVGIVQWAMS